MVSTYATSSGPIRVLIDANTRRMHCNWLTSHWTIRVIVALGLQPADMAIRDWLLIWGIHTSHVILGGGDLIGGLDQTAGYKEETYTQQPCRVKRC